MRLNELDIRVDHVLPTVVVVEFRGEYDMANKAEITALLRTLVDGHELVVVDLSETQFIDSSFIHALIAAAGQARANGTRFRLQVPPNAIVKTALMCIGMFEALACVQTRTEALAGAALETPRGGARDAPSSPASVHSP